MKVKVKVEFSLDNIWNCNVLTVSFWRSGNEKNNKGSIDKVKRNVFTAKKPVHADGYFKHQNNKQSIATGSLKNSIIVCLNFRKYSQNCVAIKMVAL